LRAEWTYVATEGPFGAMDVPTDAMTWDPTSQQWKEVDLGSNATSKVIFRPLYSNWHHGISMDISDLLYTQYFLFEWGTCLENGDATCDPEYTSQAEVAIPLYKGFRLLPSGEFESYIDIWHYDEKEIADSGIFWASEPWEITAATERLVTSGKLSYSRTQASTMNVPWLDPIVPEHAFMIREELQKMKDDNFIPAALRDFVTLQDAVQRYDASMQWIDEHKHAIISNGAFYLDSYNIAGRIITVKAFKDSTYPFAMGYWQKYEKPRLADILTINIPSSVAIENVLIPRSVLIGQPLAITLSIGVEGNLSNDALVSYFILDKDGKVIIAGVANSTETNVGQFRIELSLEDTSKLSIGPNQVRIFANSFYAFRPDISERTIIALPT
jgi:peptide/nickel transport system substrate-binding protein